MAQQDGRLLVLKRKGDGNTWLTVASMRERSFGIENGEVDTTVPDAVDPSLKVQGTSDYGVQTYEFSGDCLFDAAVRLREVADDARLQRKTEYQVIHPDYGTYQGLFMVGSFVNRGEMAGKLACSITLKPAGAIAFTAVTP